MMMCAAVALVVRVDYEQRRAERTGDDYDKF